MTPQEIVAELEKLDPLERAKVIAHPRQSDQLLTENSSADSEEAVWDVLQKYEGTMPELPKDMSINHDYYLYGVPKRRP